MVISPVSIGLASTPAPSEGGGCGCGGCGCGGGGSAEATTVTTVTTVTTATTDTAAEESTSAAYAVDGMTCGHCVKAVTEELSALPGVTDVGVELVAGGTSTVTVRSAAPLAVADVRAAVDEAGYALVGQD